MRLPDYIEIYDEPATRAQTVTLFVILILFTVIGATLMLKGLPLVLRVALHVWQALR